MKMEEWLSRSAMLFGEDGLARLKRAHIAVFGVGGVGGYAVEALARSGVGALDLIDSDTVSLSNLNRQIIATHDTLGMYKVDAAKARVLAINPQAQVEIYRLFFLPETAEQFDFCRYDYVIDAVDTVSAKLALAERAYAAGTPIISAMGAGNKLDPTAFEVADIFETSVCPLARVMRAELRKRGIPYLKVVYSRELPVKPQDGAPQTGGKRAPGSCAFVPAAAGLILAGEVVKEIAFGAEPAHGRLPLPLPGRLNNTDRVNDVAVVPANGLGS